MMVSEKMRELGTKKSTIREIFEYGRKRAQEVGEENICDFSLGNPNVPAPDFIKQAVLAIMTEMEPQAVHGYTVAPGNPAVRETLAASINERFGTHFSGRNLFMTAGAAAAITVCFKALAEEGDEFIAFAPFFPEYRCFVESVGANLRVVPAKTEDFQIDFAALEERLSPRTKGVIVNSPNNPSGAVYSEKTIKELAALLRKKQQEYDHPIFLVSDEPYREIAYGCEVPYTTKYYENTLVCYSYSKSFSLAGERIGYIVVPDEVADFSSVYGAVAGAARVLTHVNAPSLWQLVVARCARPSRVSSRRARSTSSRGRWRRTTMPSVSAPRSTTSCSSPARTSAAPDTSARPTASRSRRSNALCRSLRSWRKNTAFEIVRHKIIKRVQSTWQVF